MKFYGNDNETFVVQDNLSLPASSIGSIWCIQNSDNYPKSFKVKALPLNAVELSTDILDEELIREAERIETELESGVKV